LNADWKVRNLWDLDSTWEVAVFVADCVRAVDRWYETGEQ
jgi:hypothetical protein